MRAASQVRHLTVDHLNWTMKTFAPCWSLQDSGLTHVSRLALSPYTICKQLDDVLYATTWSLASCRKHHRSRGPLSCASSGTCSASELLSSCFLRACLTSPPSSWPKSMVTSGGCVKSRDSATPGRVVSSNCRRRFRRGLRRRGLQGLYSWRFVSTVTLSAIADGVGE